MTLVSNIFKQLRWWGPVCGGFWRQRRSGRCRSARAVAAEYRRRPGFVRVTNDTGPVAGLTAADFAVKLDGTALDTFTSSLPPDQDPATISSVVFVLGYSSVIPSSILAGVSEYINQMATGAYAGIVRFKPDLEALYTWPVVQALTLIDGGAGNKSLIDFLSKRLTLLSAVRAPHVNLLDGATRAIDEFAMSTGTVPKGPKAIILIGDGDRNSESSHSDVVAYANQNGIPIFTIGLD